MKLGLGLGLGVGGNSLPRYVTDYFNGFELSGSTYSGGPVVTEDNTGALVTSPAGVLPITGMRLATTVADGAVLGPELCVNGDFSSENISYLNNHPDTTSIVVNGELICTSDKEDFEYAGAVIPLATVVGKKYRILATARNITTTYVRIRALAGETLSATMLAESEYFYDTAEHNITLVFVATTTTSGVYLRGVSTPALKGAQAGFDNVSVREVIPTWLPTDTNGDPIHPSTPLRTRKGTVSVYGEDFRGPLVEPARTNKVTCRKANPTDTTNITKSGDAAAVLSVVDDSAALAAAGLDKICTSGKVYKLDNSEGAATAIADFSGQTGNTNVHSCAIYVRGVGTGIFGISLGLSVNYTASGSYVQVKNENKTPANSTNILAIRVNAGGVVYFILPQLEEGAFVTSPIALDSTGADPLTALTRPAANLTRPTAGTALASGNDFAIYGRVIPEAAGQGDQMLLATYFTNPAVNFTTVQASSGNDTVRFRKYINGAIVAEPSTSYAYAANTPFEYLVYQHSVHGMGIVVRSWNGSAWSAWSTWATNPNTQNAPIASTYQIGARNNSNHFAANYPFTEIIKIPASVEPQAWLMEKLSRGRI